MIVILTISLESVYAEENKTIQVEIKYTNGDIVDFSAMKIIVYQDLEKTPILEKKLTSNPEYITVPENHRYKIEVYANGMYADVGYIQSNTSTEKLNIGIPLSGGINFEIYYKDGYNPIKDATIVLKSHDNSVWGKTITNDQGKTNRFWIQSTTQQDDHYIADVYLGDLFLTSYYPIAVAPGIAFTQKITTDIPEIVQEQILINLYTGSKKITSDDGNYKVTLSQIGVDDTTSNVDFRGNAYFSSLKSGTYTVKITTNSITESVLWPQTKINIIGDLNNFNIFKNTESNVNQEDPFQSCNCISFRLDDIQDYWLADTQIELINLFVEKNIPLTVGVIGGTIGSDERITSILKDKLEKNNIEIANHSWDNEIVMNMNKEIQEEKIGKTNERILELFGISPKIFIPPQNLYDENTVKILIENEFTHLVSLTEDNNETFIVDDLFYNVPAITETGDLLDNNQWQLRENDYIMNNVTQSLNQRGYAIIMVHPQEFSLNDKGDYDSPNQESILQLSLLIDEISQLDSKIVKISEVVPSDEIIKESIETQVEDKVVIDSCNCVAFRFDGVQDYWLNDVQIKIMETFIENDTPLTIGILANAFGNDQKITEFVKHNIENNGKYIEVATKGIDLTPFTNYDKVEQNKNLKESIDLIESNVDVRPQVFIPPDNKFNSDTLEILKKNNITHISTSLVNGDSPPFEFKEKEFYRFPQTASTGKYDLVNNVFEGISSKQTLSDSIQSITNYGFSVISIQPQEFSMIENSTYVNSINEEQVNELKSLINELNEKGYKIVPVGKINSNLIVIVPEWIKNNAEWWADGTIDDKTFVEGIEYLVQENIINVSGESQEVSNEKNIPIWIKNNAEWWASGEIDNKTFVDGIEYLVKNGIIIH